MDKLFFEKPSLERKDEIIARYNELRLDEDKVEGVIKVLYSQTEGKIVTN